MTYARGILALTFSVLLLLILPVAHAFPLRNDSLSFSFTTRALDPNDVTATVLSESSPISSSLFGSIYPTPAPSSAFSAGVHPRIVMGQPEWDALVSRYADDTHFDVVGSWSRYHRRYTLSKSVTSSFISSMAALQDDSTMELYNGATTDLSVLSEAERKALKPLADKALDMTELYSGSFFMCALWVSVNRKRVADLGEAGRFLSETQNELCVKATVAWATVMLAHRAYHCNPNCPSSSDGRGNLWLYSKRWEVQNDWYTGGLGMALAYDVLHDDFSVDQKRTVRSAIALLVMKRFSWGNSITSDRVSPNAEIHPHRIFSNWGPYHSNLYLANLAIEGETDFDVYTSAVLAAENETGFNSGLNTRFVAMIDAYLAHSFYPDGTTFEDGYSYSLALREGSLGLVAAHRRGVATLDTPRFRNLIHNAAQMYEPWHCGNILGHASGGGTLYPAHMALFRYAYPDGVLPNMLWRLRMGSTFKNNDPCRIEWHQNMVQLAILGGEHGPVTNAESLSGLSAAHQAQIPTSFYGPRRGLLIARNSLSENSILLHFDARADAFYPGHDNADRGIFTFTALRKTWIDDIPWRENPDSRRHSLMHVDGLAQDEKAPCVKMLKVQDDGDVVISSADLTYAYNVQWARNWPDYFEPTVHVIVYDENGNRKKVNVKFTEKETGDPRDFGWPEGDQGADLGLARPESNMHGDPDMGFLGMWTWKRDYRTTKLSWAVRSTALVRSDEASGPGYVLVTDSFKVSGTAGDHTFESYLILGTDVTVASSSSSCTDNKCLIVLEEPSSSKQVDIHIVTMGTVVSYRTETFDGYKRLIIKSEGMQAEEFWMALSPHSGNDNGFNMVKVGGNVMQVTYGSSDRFFKLSDATHDLEMTVEPAVAPMSFTSLAFLDKVTVNANEMSDNSKEFLHDSGAEYQTVFKVTGNSPKREDKGDLLTTCFKETTMAGHLAIYDCGEEADAEANYNTRACSMVAESSSSDICRRFRRKLVKRLTRGKPYFVAVSMSTRAGVPKFVIEHKIGVRGLSI